MPKPGDKNYKGGVHEAIRKSPLGGLMDLFDKPKKPNTKRRSTYQSPQEIRSGQARARRSSAYWQRRGAGMTDEGAREVERFGNYMPLVNQAVNKATKPKKRKSKIQRVTLKPPKKGK